MREKVCVCNRKVVGAEKKDKPQEQGNFVREKERQTIKERGSKRCIERETKGREQPLQWTPLKECPEDQ